MKDDKENSSLEARIKTLEDINEIKELKYWYSYHANISDSKPGDLVAFGNLFSETAEWDVGLGCFIGPKAIVEAMRGTTSQWVSVMHLMINPIITVDGDTATGRWSGLFPFVAPNNPRPIWVCLIYNETYVRVGKNWKFQSVKATPMFQPPPEFFELYQEFLQKNGISNPG